MTRPIDEIARAPYRSYAYAYPHKTAYRRFAQPIPLRDLWAQEQRDALFLYMHIPFCEMRCGFCNLFTTVNPAIDIERAYMDALERQAAQVRGALGQAQFARFAIGGGTPTYLPPADLHRLFDIAERVYGVRPHDIPVSVETSPKTADAERLAVLRERGADRISIGVQSFIEREAAAAGRPQKTADVERALDRIRSFGFPTLNIDLIYGIDGQTVESWLETLRAALRYQPEQLYLYPLYVRPLTGLGRRQREWDDVRLACYRAGRDFLREHGYQQLSMRMFRSPTAPAGEGPVYCCQQDGMVGLGCGARSYTRAAHYSSEYAVGATGVRAILADYIRRDDESFASAHYGFPMGEDDARRRYVIQSLLQAEGLDMAAYQARFGGAATTHLPELAALAEHGLATRSPAHMRLTERGMELSDAIGPWLYAESVQRQMEEFDLT